MRLLAAAVAVSTDPAPTKTFQKRQAEVLGCSKVVENRHHPHLVKIDFAGKSRV